MATIYPQKTRQSLLVRLYQRMRVVVIALVTLVTILSVGVVLAQKSANYALACQPAMSNGGGTIANGSQAVIFSLGQPFAMPRDTNNPPVYALRSATYGLRSGFLPGYPASQVVASGEATAAPGAVDQGFIQRLPIIKNLVAVLQGSC